MVVEEDIDQYIDQGDTDQGSPIMTLVMSFSPERKGSGGHAMDELIYFAAIKNIRSTLYGKEVLSHAVPGASLTSSHFDLFV